MIRCKKCGWQHENESDVELHHIIPRWMGGKDSDGRLYLCGNMKGNDCHIHLHNFLKNKTKEITLRWLEDDKL